LFISHRGATSAVHQLFRTISDCRGRSNRGPVARTGDHRSTGDHRRCRRGSSCGRPIGSAMPFGRSGEINYD
jgi:hypothetical protein